jgi:hypothetical protein
MRKQYFINKVIAVSFDHLLMTAMNEKGNLGSIQKNQEFQFPIIMDVIHLK